MHRIRIIRAAATALAGAALGAALAAGGAAATTPSGDRGAGDGGRGTVPDQVVVGLRGGGERVIELPAGVRTRAVLRSLRRNEEVSYAGRNWIARAAVDPLDGGRSGEEGGWREDQWNFLAAPGGVRVERAWARAEQAGSPGGEEVKVAVVDTGVAYGGPSPSPDFAPESFARGRDFVDGDTEPLDENGHGTHIAGTIAEQVTLADDPVPEGERDYLTGLAYGATLIPVRVLDRRGIGTSADVARGVRWAAKRGAEVINLSLGLPARVRRCAQVRGLCRAVRTATRQGALVVAAAGNTVGGGRKRVSFPAAVPGVLAVGAATERGCLAGYSDYGTRLDLLAPGGGRPHRRIAAPRCRGDRTPIFQVSFSCFPNQRCTGSEPFGIRPARGTSMATAHASGVAALVRASESAGLDPGPTRIRNRLTCSARPLKRRLYHGSGLLDATRATRATPPRRCP